MKKIYTKARSKRTPRTPGEKPAKCRPMRSQTRTHTRSHTRTHIDTHTHTHTHTHTLTHTHPHTHTQTLHPTQNRCLEAQAALTPVTMLVTAEFFC